MMGWQFEFFSGMFYPSVSLKGNKEKVLTGKILINSFFFLALGVMNDNFVESPPESLDWPIRRFLMLQEIIQYDPDIICLEVSSIAEIFIR